MAVFKIKIVQNLAFFKIFGIFQDQRFLAFFKDFWHFFGIFQNQDFWLLRFLAFKSKEFLIFNFSQDIF